MGFLFDQDKTLPRNFGIVSIFRICENTIGNLFTLYDASDREILSLTIGNDIELNYLEEENLTSIELTRDLMINDGKYKTSF